MTKKNKFFTISLFVLIIGIAFMSASCDNDATSSVNSGRHPEDNGKSIYGISYFKQTSYTADNGNSAIFYHSYVSFEQADSILIGHLKSNGVHQNLDLNYVITYHLPEGDNLIIIEIVKTKDGRWDNSARLWERKDGELTRGKVYVFEYGYTG